VVCHHELAVSDCVEVDGVLVGSSRYVGAKQPPRAPRDLQTWDFVLPSSRPAELTLSSTRIKKSISLALSAKVSVDSAAAMRELSLAGAGIAALPEVTVRSDLARGRLVEVLSDWHLPPVGVYTLWPANTQRPGLTLRFIEFMASRIEALFSTTSA